MRHPGNQRNQKAHTPKTKSAWEEAGEWYGNLVGQRGHYYHQQVIIPGVLKLLGLKAKDSLFDLGCGQGVLARAIPANVTYLGIDAAPTLIKESQQRDRQPNHQYVLADATEVKKYGEFSHAAAILSVQNMGNLEGAIANLAKNLKTGGVGALVLNHPSFRIPRQSGWGTFPQNKLQYRWVTKYNSSMEVPFVTHLPGGKKIHSISYHFSLGTLFETLKKNNFLVSELEEWSSDKVSEGRHAKKENRARQEFPLFMAIKIRKS